MAMPPMYYYCAQRLDEVLIPKEPVAELRNRPDFADIITFYSLYPIVGTVMAESFASLSECELLDEKFFNSIPYFRKIKMPNQSTVVGKWILRVMKPQPVYEAFASKQLEDGRLRISVCDMECIARISLGELSGDMAIMSITPNEIYTMEAPIAAATGNVLTFGLGLGYYAYSAHIKPEVTSVTIVEHDPDIIEIFNTYILPQFDYPEKIKVIHADAYEFASKTDSAHYSSVFVDIWYNCMDGINCYLEFLSMGWIGANISYWLEDVLIDTLKQQLNSYPITPYMRRLNTTSKPRRVILTSKSPMDIRKAVHSVIKHTASERVPD